MQNYYAVKNVAEMCLYAKVTYVINLVIYVFYLYKKAFSICFHLQTVEHYSQRSMVSLPSSTSTPLLKA